MKKLDHQKETDTVCKKSWWDELFEEWGFTDEAKQRKATERQARIDKHVDEMHEAPTLDDLMADGERNIVLGPDGEPDIARTIARRRQRQVGHPGRGSLYQTQRPQRQAA